MNGFEQKDNSSSKAEKKENIEMVVIADNNNVEECKRSESLSLFHNNSNNNNINENNSNSLINYNSNDYIERLTSNNTTTSVIDLEVDVHHRNSSGSSIGISSERSKSHSETVNTTQMSNSCAPLMMTSNQWYSPNNELSSELTQSEINEMIAGSDVNLTNKANELIENCEGLMKGMSLELGFMAQDPAVLRAQTNQNIDSQSNRKRSEPAVVRRARSELETTQCSSDKKLSSLPPSHPVSLEIIGTTKRDSDLTEASNNENECLLRRVTPNLNEKSSLLNQQNRSDIRVPNSPNLKSTQFETVKSSPVLSEYRARSCGEKESHIFVEVEESPQNKQNKSSDGCDDGDESDVSLVVNFSAKIKKRKVHKSSKPRRTLNRRKVSKSLSSGKISSNKKSEKIIQFSDNTNPKTEDNKKCVQNFSSESDIESSHNGSDSYTSHSSTSLSSSHSSISLSAETTPLTASYAAESETKSNASNSRHNSVALEPKCIAGPSRQVSHENKIDLIKRLSAKNESQDLAHNYVLRNELQRRRKRSKRGEPNASTHLLQNTDNSEPNIDNIAGASLVSGLELTQNISADNGPPPYMLARILSAPGTHLAKSHEDTNVGAVHVFQDERGNWLTYTFDDNSTGVARGLMNNDKSLLDIELYSAMRAQAGHHKWNSSSSSSGSTVVLDSPANVLHTPKLLQTGLHSQFGDTHHELSRVLPPNTNTLFAESFPSLSFILNILY